MEFRINQAPSSALEIVGTNLAYVHPSTFNGKQTYLKVNKHIFLVESHENMKVGDIGLNKIQRISAQVSEGRKYTCEIFNVPTHNFHLDNISVGKFI